VKDSENLLFSVCMQELGNRNMADEGSEKHFKAISSKKE
jgi:hypothetical protein